MKTGLKREGKEGGRNLRRQSREKRRKTDRRGSEDRETKMRERERWRKRIYVERGREEMFPNHARLR